MQDCWVKQVTLPLKFICNADGWVRININQQTIDVFSSQKRSEQRRKRKMIEIMMIVLGDTNKLYEFYHYF